MHGSAVTLSVAYAETHSINVGIRNIFSSMSDDSDDELALGLQSCLMDEVGLVEGALCELTHEHQLEVKEQIRSKLSALEKALMGEIEKSASALTRVEKYREARWEMNRKFDTQYQRKIAEALDNHLTAVQRDHELRSQIEERKIRSDAAFEEAKRKEKALQEEKIRQEKAKAEFEARLRAEEAKRAALEVERREAKEAAERVAIETSTRVAAGVAKEAAVRRQMDAISVTSNETKGFPSDAKKHPQSESNVLRAAESALSLEQGRLQKFKEIEEINQALREKSHEIVKIFNDPLCPQSISIAAFVKKVVTRCESPDNDAFACGHVLVLVISQVPLAMDLLLAEFHRACIYTVPKHIVYSESAFESKEAYYKAIGFQETDGKIESIDDYLRRLESYIKLYGALIQTQVEGVRNIHGLEQGWAWIARFLNTMPANRYTAVALNAFLQMAGFALFRKYKSQFMKVLSIISDNFLEALKAREEPGLRAIIVEIQSYMEDKKFLKEPDGRGLQGTLLSSVMVPEPDYQQSYHHQPANRYFY
ncbi:Nucleoporin GLE1 [Morella rubra]|uniref:mRNA export factor GLE1 n=1 Tax=Morella rubra TaxID=262757 RepID=A0A6A1VJU7_9ROSI|nr:Nucleoporin GLE1 [Morella rubra]